MCRTPLRLLQEQDLRKLDMTNQLSTRYYSIPSAKELLHYTTVRVPFLKLK